MRVLREAGVTSTRVRGVHRYIRLRRADLDALYPGLLDAVIMAPHGWPDEAPSPAGATAAL
jgi:hypothetical protein